MSYSEDRPSEPSDAELIALYFRNSSVGETCDERTAMGLRAVYEAGRAAREIETQ